MRSLFFASLTAGAFLIGVSCERHDWEETKILHESHGDHGGDAAGHDKDAGHEEGGSGDKAEH